MTSRPTTAAATRAAFLDFFREKGHTIVPSAPLVPQDDPTLLFINSGMAPFKDVFLGTGSRPYVRVADTQKCLRVSGKHNDLEEVGLDTYHHTLFEMLGNWSFGDYFKREAIAWAWELLVDRWGLDPARLYATVHQGDPALGLEPDREAADLWTELTTIPPAHILFQGSKDNFWMMGDTGPCGPCSEIHVDLRPDAERAVVPGQELVNKDDPRVMEIWNLVFIQYNASRTADGGTALEPLAAKHVDTGMGFERICAVLQGKSSNYDIDLFAPILAAISDAAGLDGYDALDESDAEDRARRIAMRVIADHVRTLAFAIADGAQPGNTGRGYVIRRILRRAVRYGYQTLGLKEPFLHSLIQVVSDAMGEAFPDLPPAVPTVARIVRAEEESFLKTLAGGIEMFDAVAGLIVNEGGGTLSMDLARTRAMRNENLTDVQKATQLKAVGFLDKAYLGDLDGAIADFRAKAETGVVPGEVAFLLHDTYGFPSDLTALMARERGLSVDEARFEELMAEQKTRARAARSQGADLSAVDTWDAHADAPGALAFVGYDTLTAEGARIVRSRTVRLDGGADRHELVLDVTPFYAESGGQIGDTGTLTVGDETLAVLDTVKDADGATVHVVDRLPSHPTAPVTAAVDAARRARIQRHHSATHLLHAALRETLGTHVQQRGSLVAPDRLRFDFAHFERMTPDEVRAVERRVNELVLANIVKGEDRDVPIDEARRPVDEGGRGATALFGEKYGERVRVITFDPDVSVELCGGTHVASTGEIGLVRLTHESSVAAGIRRVEAVAGEAALDWLDATTRELDAARGLFKQVPDGLAAAVVGVQDEAKRLAREVTQLRAAQAAGQLDAWLDTAHDVAGARLVAVRVDGADGEALRLLAEEARTRLGSGVAVFGAASDGKALLAASVTDDLVSRGVQAGALVGVLAKAVGGGGGGRPTLATAGGKSPEKLDDALALAAGWLAERLG